VQHVRRLADAGQLTKVARGLIDRQSLDRYQLEHRRTRTRAWAEHTAWGAIAPLSGYHADWLGPTQAWRVRHTLQELDDPAEFIVRTRERARVHTYSAHSAALPRLRKKLVVADLAKLGIVGASGESRIDGYLVAEDLDSTVRSLGLLIDAGGNVTLRATGFHFEIVRALVTSSSVVAALDAATSIDPRIRGVGERALTEALGALQPSIDPRNNTAHRFHPAWRELLRAIVQTPRPRSRSSTPPSIRRSVARSGVMAGPSSCPSRFSDALGDGHGSRPSTRQTSPLRKVPAAASTRA
jgi:hypothetical protein